MECLRLASSLYFQYGSEFTYYKSSKLDASTLAKLLVDDNL